METIGTTTRDETQLVFLDLPGIVGPEHYRNKAHECKVTMGWAAASTCDAILFVVDANRQAKKADWRGRETIDTMTGQMRKLRYEEFLSSEEEDDENTNGLTRLVAHFNRRNHGRLRQLINFINTQM